MPRGKKTKRTTSFRDLASKKIDTTLLFLEKKLTRVGDGLDQSDVKSGISILKELKECIGELPSDFALPKASGKANFLKGETVGVKPEWAGLYFGSKSEAASAVGEVDTILEVEAGRGKKTNLTVEFDGRFMTGPAAHFQHVQET